MERHSSKDAEHYIADAREAGTAPQDTVD